MSARARLAIITLGFLVFPLTVVGAGDGAGEEAVVPDQQSERDAIDEMLLGVEGRLEEWPEPPGLVVMVSVMEPYGDSSTRLRAMQARVTDAEADQLVADMTRALGLLTNGRLEAFASVSLERVAQGTVVNISQPGKIVVMRYQGMRENMQVLGLGGRRTDTAGTITSGTILLDEAYDRMGAQRELLRMHELGHALGFNHVESTPSIMNPRIGQPLTDFDTRAVRLAATASSR